MSDLGMMIQIGADKEYWVATTQKADGTQDHVLIVFTEGWSPEGLAESLFTNALELDEGETLLSVNQIREELVLEITALNDAVGEA